MPDKQQLERFESRLRDGPSHTEVWVAVEGWSITRWGNRIGGSAGDSSSWLIPHLSPLSRKQRGAVCELSWFSPLPPLMESRYHPHSRQLLPSQLIFSENVLTERYTSPYSFIQSRHFTIQSSEHSKFTITYIQFTDGWSEIYTPGTAAKLCCANCPVELSLQPVDLPHTWETEPAKQPPAGYPGDSGARKCRGI